MIDTFKLQKNKTALILLIGTVLLTGFLFFGYSGNADAQRELRDPQCSDGKDNDNDNLIDYPRDPGCNGPADPTEFNPPSPSPVTLSISANPLTVTEGKEVTINWNPTNAASCVASGDF